MPLAARVLNIRARNLKNCLYNLAAPPVAVLLYHRVCTPAEDSHSLAVSPENFRAQMRYLKEHYRLVRFEEDWSALRQPAVAVTFDDGYADNFTTALPILEETGVPATFFITTGRLGGERQFWWDELEGLALTPRKPRESLRGDEGGVSRVFPTRTLDERKAMHREVHALMMQADEPGRKRWLEELRTWSGGAYAAGAGNRTLTAEELRALAASPLVTVGAHTVSHAPLSSLPEEAQRQEIVASQRELEILLGRSIEVFSYPFGKKSDYDETTLRLCRESGFAKAAAAFAGQWYRWTDPYQIPRHFMLNWDLESFIVKIRSMWI